MPDQQSFTAVAPVKPLAPYIGGKRLLARRLVPLIETVPHDLYCEVFMGMGGIFFRRSARPKVEVINDFSRDVATLFRILQRHYQPFMDELKWKLGSRAEFQRLIATDPDTLTDLERAARFLYLQRTTFGGKVEGRTFGVSRTIGSRFDLTRLASMLEDAHERLAGVTIECLDWQSVIARYDGPRTLFYLDPPYFGTEHYYGRELFSRDAFELMATRLAGIKGGFILSINDAPEVRRIFAGFHIEAVETSYSVQGGHTKPVGELIIRGRR